MNFGKIEEFVFFGGGRLLAETALSLKRSNVRFTVIANEKDSQAAVVRENLNLMDFLKKNSIEFNISEDVNLDHAVVSKITTQTLGLSFGIPAIFGNDFIRMFEGRLVNIHEGRIPQADVNGAFSWRILRNSRLQFRAIHQINLGSEIGDIVELESYFFPRSCRIPADYENYMVNQYNRFVGEFIDGVISGKDFPVSKEKLAHERFCPILKTELNGYIDWKWSLSEIEEFVCAFDDPYGGAITFLNGNKVRMKDCASTTSDGKFHPFQKGVVYRIDAGRVFVATEDGSLILGSIYMDNDKGIIAEVKLGDRFLTPDRFLERGKELVV